MVYTKEMKHWQRQAGKHALNYRRRIYEARPDIKSEPENQKIMAIWVIQKMPFY